MEPRIDLIKTEIGAKIAKSIFSLNLAIEKSTLPAAVKGLVMLRASQINGCALCVDIHTKESAAAGETALRLNLVAVWREATVFTEAERAALALAEEGTRIADAHHGVSDETWATAREHYDEDQLASLVSLVALINMANRLNVIVRNLGGSYEPGMMAGLSS